MKPRKGSADRKRAIRRKDQPGTGLGAGLTGLRLRGSGPHALSAGPAHVAHWTRSLRPFDYQADCVAAPARAQSASGQLAGAGLFLCACCWQGFHKAPARVMGSVRSGRFSAPVPRRFTRAHCVLRARSFSSTGPPGNHLICA